MKASEGSFSEYCSILSRCCNHIGTGRHHAKNHLEQNARIKENGRTVPSTQDFVGQNRSMRTLVLTLLAVICIPNFCLPPQQTFAAPQTDPGRAIVDVADSEGFLRAALRVPK